MSCAPPHFPLSPSGQFAARLFGGYLGLNLFQSPYLEFVWRSSEAEVQLYDWGSIGPAVL